MTNLYRFLKLLFISLLISLISLSDFSSVAFAQSSSQNKELNLSQNPSFFKENLKNVRDQEDIKSISPFLGNEFVFYLNQSKNSSSPGKKANQDFSNIRGDMNISFTAVKIPSIDVGFLNVNIPVNIQEINFFKIVNINNENKSSNQALQAFQLYQAGQKELENQEYEKAAKYFTLALTFDDQFSEAYAQRGFAYYNSDDYEDEDALKDFNIAISGSQPKLKDHINNPKLYVDPRILRGWFYIKTGNYEAAHRDLSEAIKRSPEVYQSYLYRAVVYLSKLDYLNAIKDLDMAIKKDSTSQDAFLLRGSIKAELGKYEDAIRDFEKVIDLNKKEKSSFSLAEPYYKQGLAELNLGNYEAAIKSFNEAKNNNSNYPELSYNQGLAYYYQKNLGQAINSYGEEIKRNPEFLEAYYQRGKTYHENNNLDSAKADLEKVLNQDKQYIEAEMELANTYFDLAVKSNKDQISNLELSDQVYQQVIQNSSQKSNYQDYVSQADSRRKIIKNSLKNFLEDKAIFPIISSPDKFGHGLVSTIAISPSGDRIASGGDKNIVKISNFEQVQKEKPFDNQNQVYTLVFNPHKNKLAIGGAKSLKIWDLNFGKGEAFQLPNDNAIIRSLVYDSTGQILISAGENTRITFWDEKTSEQIWTIPTPTKKINSLALNEKWLVSGGDDKVLRIYDYKTRKEIPTLDKDHGHQDIIRAIVISPDNQLLISGSNDKTIKIWDLNSGKFRYPLTGHTQSVTSLAITSDSQFLASGADDGTVRIWDLKQRQELATLSFPSSYVHPPVFYVQSVAFTPDNKFLVAGGDNNGIKVWKMPF
ncbi:MULTISPECIES: tetratricopeptide repeat protein [Planktothrix]|uniref:Histone acetyltransferase n=1 Tax=Planktothrix rubescens CCAP 1459/22 TaxID=329571 RepID=A0A6J7ZPP2_PLARU|nr:MULTISPECIES: tetratricopeptide repeat protein [Planktothrix]CAC5344547.1 putative Histone acetyltransferase [Planktothrix rubescens NIVA-CYA 18]CAD5918780.1 putative WD repeat-containing protein alr3466 [Planktothrix rubescens NIVA-CYA 18]